MKYQVFENDKPADCHSRKLHPSWDNSTFDTLPKAIKYAHNYMGAYTCCDNGQGTPIPDSCPVLIPGKRYDMTGYKDFLEIREV